MSSKPKAAPQKTASKLVTVWVPKPLHEAIKTAVSTKETDKSKWIRQAMREKAARDGIAH